MLPEITARCFTRSGCRRANWKAEVAPDEMAITSSVPIPRSSSSAANASAWSATVARAGMLEPR